MMATLRTTRPSLPDRLAEAVAFTPRQLFAFALFWLILAAGIGAFLRSFAVFGWEVPVFVHWRHAHSHLMFLGWGFNVLVALMLQGFVPSARWPKYGLPLLVAQASVLGMAYFFPREGYGLAAIVYSSLHLVAALWVLALWWADTRGQRGQMARAAVGWAVVFFLLSALAPAALGVVKANGLGGSPWYRATLNIYLHFHYNGWFVFALLGIGLRHLANVGFWGSEKRGHKGLRWLAIGTVLTYGLLALPLFPHLSAQSTAWAVLLYTLAGGGACLQIGGLWWLVRAFWGNWRYILSLFGSPWWLVVAAGSLLLKSLLQVAESLPPVAEFALHSPSVAVAYLHLVFIGWLTVGALGMAHQAGWIRGWLPALKVFAVAFACTELLLLLQPFAVLPGHWTALFAFSVAMCAALIAALVPYPKRTP